MDWSKHLILCLLLLMLPLGGCRVSYKLNGSALDYNIYRTISVGNFPIRAALVYAPLQQTFENALLDYIQRNTRLQTAVDGTNSDLQIEGEITNYALSPQAVGCSQTQSSGWLYSQIKIYDSTGQRKLCRYYRTGWLHCMLSRHARG